ncbi:MAG TPA: glycosyltransferase family 4 protein, partial [Vicinamibacteria bacterium]
ETGRLLFIGSYAHLPNLMAVDFFLREVWPLLEDLRARLHVIAGARHEFYQAHYQSHVQLPELPAEVEVEGFVSDVRPAYRRAELVVAPLIASAGTNIKILEAMAMGKAIVATPVGIAREIVRDGENGVVVAERDGEAIHRALLRLSRDAGLRRALGERAASDVRRLIPSREEMTRRYEELYLRLRRSCYLGNVTQNPFS